MARRGPRPAARSFQDQCARRARSLGLRTWWCNAIRRLSPNSRWGRTWIRRATATKWSDARLSLSYRLVMTWWCRSNAAVSRLLRPNSWSDTPGLVRLEIAPLSHSPSHLQTMLCCQMESRRESVRKTSRRRMDRRRRHRWDNSNCRRSGNENRTIRRDIRQSQKFGAEGRNRCDAGKWTDFSAEGVTPEGRRSATE